MSVDCEGDEDVVVVRRVYRKFIYMLCEPIVSEPEPPPIYFLLQRLFVFFFLSLQEIFVESVCAFQSVVGKFCSLWESHVPLRFHAAPCSGSSCFLPF